MEGTSMLKFNFFKVVVGFSLCLNILLGYALGNYDAGKAKSQTCIACHQADGNSLAPQYPKIAGQNIRYLVKQLNDYKAGRRQNAIMSGMVAALSPQDIEDLAVYFSVQKTTLGQVKPEYLALGRKIYQGGLLDKNVPACSGCHSPDGKGNPQAAYPALSGQYPEYTVAQLQAFKAGQRRNGPNGIMKSISQNMTDEEMKAVAEYIYGLHG